MSEMIDDLGITDPALLDDIPYLLWGVVKAWHGDKAEIKKPLKAYFPSVYLEQRFEHRMAVTNPHTGERQTIVTTAKLDFHGPSNEEGHWIIGDWKSNRREDDPFYQAQMKIGAIALFSSDQSITKITTMIPWLRYPMSGKNPSVHTYTRDALRKWMQWMIKRRLFWDGVTYITGDHCTYCPRVYVCEGRKQKFRNYVNMLNQTDIDALLYDAQGIILEPEEMQRRWEVCKAFRRIDKAYNDQLKELLDGCDPLPLQGQEGYGLGLKEKQGALKIDVGAGWSTIMEYLTPKQLAPAVSVGKKKLEDAVKGAMRMCEACDGLGLVDSEVETSDPTIIDVGSPCPACDGKGEVEVYPHGTKGEACKSLMEKLEQSGAAKRGTTSKEIAVVELKKEE